MKLRTFLIALTIISLLLTSPFVKAQSSNGNMKTMNCSCIYGSMQQSTEKPISIVWIALGTIIVGMGTMGGVTTMIVVIAGRIGSSKKMQNSSSKE